MDKINVKGSTVQRTVVQLLMPSLLATGVLLTGCANTVKTAGKVAEVIYDPDIQVGPNEMQPSKVSLAALSQGAQTTVSPNVKRGLFAASPAPNSYSITLYEIGSEYFAKAEEGVLSANAALAIADGEYIAKHQYSLKVDGYRFVDHFAVDEAIKGLIAMIEFEEPKCAVWSPVRAIKGTGEEYNFYFMGEEQHFLLRSEQDISAPGEPVKKDNRFIGNCGNQFNALAADADPQGEVPKLVMAYQRAAHEAPILSLMSAQAAPVDEVVSVNDSAPVVPQQAVAQVVHKQPAVQKSAATQARTIEQPIAAAPSSAKVASAAPRQANTQTVIDQVLNNQSARQWLQPASLARYPSAEDARGQRIYFIAGLGRVDISSGALSVRAQPGLESRRTTLLAKGKAVQVHRYSAQGKGWIYVESEGARPGWVSEPLVDWRPL
ncbi:MAG: SH3 domain-containing protein [Pseudomonadales bacterium]